MVCFSYFHSEIIHILFFFFSFLSYLDSWESPSGPCAPKLCLTSSIPKHARRVSMRIRFFVFMWLIWVYVSPRVPEDRARGLSASAYPMNHMPFFTLWRDPGYAAKLWSSLLTAAPLLSKWGMLLITGLSAAWGKMIVHDSSHFPHAILCPPANHVSSQQSYK